MELPSWLVVSIIVISIPSFAFTFYKLFTLLKEFINDKRSRRKPTTEDIERAVAQRRTSNAQRRPSSTHNVISVSTIEPKEREIRRPAPINLPPRKMSTSNKVGASSTTKQTSLENNEPTPKLSACCLDEEKLLGLGRMPFDISIVEEEREKELQKLQRAPEEPPVAKILTVARGSQSTGPTPGTTPTPSRQST